MTSLSELREIILILKNETIPLYHAKRQEQKLLLESEQTSLIQGNIELYAGYIVGYASQIGHKGFVGTDTPQETSETVRELQRFAPFRNAHIAKWFIENSTDFQHTKKYLLTIDYLRLLSIEFLEVRNEDRL